MLASKVIKEAFSQVWLRKTRFFKALIFWIFVYAGFELLIYEKYHPLTTINQIIFYVVLTTIYSLIAITTHRILLLGEKSVPLWGINTITHREVIFSILIGILQLIKPLLVSFIFPTINSRLQAFIFLIFILLLTIILIRFSVMLPAIAVDKFLSPSQAWKLTKKYQFKLFIIYIATGFTFEVAEYILVELPTVIHMPLMPLLNIFEVITLIATLSIAYREIILHEYNR